MYLANLQCFESGSGRNRSVHNYLASSDPDPRFYNRLDPEPELNADSSTPNNRLEIKG